MRYLPTMDCDYKNLYSSQKILVLLVVADNSKCLSCERHQELVALIISHLINDNNFLKKTTKKCFSYTFSSLLCFAAMSDDQKWQTSHI